MIYLHERFANAAFDSKRKRDLSSTYFFAQLYACFSMIGHALLILTCILHMRSRHILSEQYLAFWLARHLKEKANDIGSLVQYKTRL